MSSDNQTTKPTYLSLAREWLKEDADDEYQAYEMQLVSGLCNEVERLRTALASIGVQQNVTLIWKISQDALNV